MSGTMGAATGAPSELAPLRAKSGWIVALGVVYVIAGVIALGSVVFATVVSVFIVGVMMLIAGVAEVFNAFQIKTWGKFLLWLVLGALYLRLNGIAFGEPKGKVAPVEASYIPMFVHFGIVLAAGIYLPPVVVSWFQTVAGMLG